ncbi:MAG: porin PorA family protein [bacterium]|nr:porin PorA family protein [bacterium]
MQKRTCHAASILLFFSIPIWMFWVAPAFTKMSALFRYEAKIFSEDNFYDQARGNFGPLIDSQTLFYYEIDAQKNGVYIIKNIFNVKTPSGNPIFMVERRYGIDPKTGTHVAGYGDHNREGYLFAPRFLNKGQGYTYWHINYDNPAHMEFQGVEKILGLTVYRYETDYHADQTKNLGHLPGVPEKRGVNLDINLQTWIEPISGYLVKYEDNATAYYYDRATGERIHPWNRFHNQYTKESLIDTIREASSAKYNILMFERLIPVLLFIAGICMAILGFKKIMPIKDHS